MAYLTYDQYKEMGYSTVTDTDFPRYERIARGDVNYYTFNRITETTEAIKLTLCEIIELYANDSADIILSGVSTGKYSESYATPEARSKDTRIRDICLKYLPQSLTTWVVGQ